MPKARRKPAHPADIVRVPVEPADGPTERQTARSAYRKVERLPGIERATIHEMENRLRELEWLGALNARQREAGELFERDYWTTSATGGTRDPLDLTPRGSSHETDLEAERIKRARARVRDVRTAAGIWYASLRDLCVFRQRLKSAAITMPPILDKVGDVYGLPRRD